MDDKKLNDLKKYKIGVLAGGTSNERDISLKSGEAVFKTLKEAGLKATFIDIDEERFDSLISHMDLDIAFLALHGRFGEDGTIQKALEEKGILYTGSGPESSHLALDKFASKDKFLEHGINTPEHVLVKTAEAVASFELWMPCVIKPRWEGSSIGLSIVFSYDELEPALEEAFKFGEEVIIERFISGREITVGILEEEALPIVEIVASGGVYDFHAKYAARDTRYIAPANLGKNIAKEAQRIALKAHQVLGCKGFSRVDIRLSPEGEIFVLEVNTIPGLTERSLLPMAAKEAGLDFFELCVKMLYGAIQ